LVLLIAALYAMAKVLDHDADDWTLTVAQNVSLCAAVLFICCMVCHGELAGLKPAPRYLTGYYVSLSVGGAAGGLFVGLVAPLIFNAYYELNIGLWLCAALATIVFARNSAGDTLGKAALLGFLIGLGAYGAWMVKIKKAELGSVELAVRNFYGHLHVSRYGNDGDPSATRQLVHGQINHGTQLLDPARRMEPVSYFCKTSGAGRALLTRDEKPMKVGVLGLGCGALLGYAKAGDEYRIYEINPLVFEIADSRFSFTRETQAKIYRVLGDARLSLEREEPQRFDRLFMDAFSGDSIPVHLVTHEAFDLYFRHLKPDGIVVVNITNSYLDLLPVVTKAAAAFGKVVVEIEDTPYEGDEECYISHYALVMSPEKLAATPALLKDAAQPKPDEHFREWTDAFSNLLAIVRR